MDEEKTGGVGPQFHSITKLLATRTVVMTRQQSLCTTTLDMFASEREHQTLE